MRSTPNQSSSRASSQLSPRNPPWEFGSLFAMKNRLKTMFNLDAGTDYRVTGEPQDVGSAQALFDQDPYQFQFWAVSLLEAQLRDQQQRGPDGGIDGMFYFIDGPRRTPQKVVIQVKGGGTEAKDVRDLKGVLDREKAAIGLVQITGQRFL